MTVAQPNVQPPAARPVWPARLAWLYLWAILLAWAFSRGVAERWWVALPLLYFPQVLYLAPAALPALVGLICRDARALGITALGALFSAWVLMGWNVPLPRLGASPSAPRVRVLAYNIQGGVQGFDALSSQIERYQPDVVIFSEALGWKDDDATREYFRRRFPGWSMLYAQEVFIASRWPFVEEESQPLGPDNVKYQGYQRRAGHVVVQAPFGRFHVLGAHFYTSMHGWTLKRERNRLPAFLGETARARRLQADQMVAWIAALEGPVLFAGDLNTPPTGSIYRDLTHILSDSFREAGFGWGYTFPSRSPMLRIDYIMHSPHWEAIQSEVGPAAGSDHRPVFAEVALTQ